MRGRIFLPWGLGVRSAAVYGPKHSHDYRRWVVRTGNGDGVGRRRGCLHDNGQPTRCGLYRFDDVADANIAGGPGMTCPSPTSWIPRQGLNMYLGPKDSTPMDSTVFKPVTSRRGNLPHTQHPGFHVEHLVHNSPPSPRNIGSVTLLSSFGANVFIPHVRCLAVAWMNAPKTGILRCDLPNLWFAAGVKGSRFERVSRPGTHWLSVNLRSVK
jgi:hypothetical protein